MSLFRSSWKWHREIEIRLSSSNKPVPWYCLRQTHKLFLGNLSWFRCWFRFHLQHLNCLPFNPKMFSFSDICDAKCKYVHQKKKQLYITIGVVDVWLVSNEIHSLENKWADNQKSYQKKTNRLFYRSTQGQCVWLRHLSKPHTHTQPVEMEIIFFSVTNSSGIQREKNDWIVAKTVENIIAIW